MTTTTSRRATTPSRDATNHFRFRPTASSRRSAATLYLRVEQSQQGSRRPQTPPPPGVATREITSSARKVVPRASVGLQQVLLRTVYTPVAKRTGSCALRFSWAATSSNLGLCANTTSSTKLEAHDVNHLCLTTLIRQIWVGRAVLHGIILSSIMAGIMTEGALLTSMYPH